jgi:hypothetical protein
MKQRLLLLASIALLSFATNAWAVPQCSDGIDNDGDGRIDGLIELPLANGQTITVGGGNQTAVFEAVRNAIISKRFPYTAPVVGRGSQILRADHPLKGNHGDEGGTIHLPTMQAVCKVLGFRTYVSSSCRDGAGKCNYYSPQNNDMWRFVGSDFRVEGASYKTWLSNIVCRDRLAACSDGWDNDGDGRVDRLDPDCLTDLDNSERPKDPQCTSPNIVSEKEQCRNGLDDDLDGLTDVLDPGCWKTPGVPGSYDPTLNNESVATSECQDGIDNDKDGAKDHPADFSCISKLDHDETNVKSQCQDGTDNDADGAIDLNDFSCSNTQDNDEANPKSLCQDGIDNDGDGATDHPSDFSCSSKQDNDETNPKSQCQDGIDNDQDSLIDAADPGCPNKQSNNEAAATTQCQDKNDNDGDGATDFPNDFSCSSATDTDEANPKAQCQDGIDNDGDGATDLSDFSCSGKQDNDEANPKSQCQDGIDNDNDGLTDLEDPACQSNQGNQEAGATAQCNDGVDNDGDGATDFPQDFSCTARADNDETNQKAQCQDSIDNDGDGATDLSDFSCSGNQDNDEANPKSQCQDGVDNDGDGLTDLEDPGCETKQGNQESSATAQCNDGLDNDNDGASDFPNDFSCTSKADKDETNQKAQCQDSIDNDGDGVVDMSDFSCSSNQDNNESDPKASCQDGLDNDNDGVADSEDPGCDGSQDNDESNEMSALSLGVECLTTNTDGTSTGYFSYNNATVREIETAIGRTGGAVNEFSPGPRNLGQPYRFKPGLSKGSVAATFSGNTLTWTVRAPGNARVTATADTATTPKCAAVVPLADCRGFEAGKVRVKMGYQNPNAFPVVIPVGASNEFTSGQTDRGQPWEFLPGLNRGVFNLDLDSSTDGTVWKINGATSPRASSLPLCSGECVDTPTGSITGELDRIAIALADSVNDGANLLSASGATDGRAKANAAREQGNQSRATRAKRVSSLSREDRADIARARKLAAEYRERSRALLLQVPSVIQNCPDAPAFCQTVDRGPTINGLIGLYAEARNTTKRVVSRAYFRQTGRTNRNDPIIRRAIRLEEEGLAQLAKIPRFATDCN